MGSIVSNIKSWGFHNKWDPYEKEYNQKVLLTFSVPIWVLTVLGLYSSFRVFINGLMPLIGLSPILMIFIFVSIQSYCLYKKNYSLSSLILYLIFSLGALFSVYSWGLAHPYGLVLFATTFYLAYLIFPSKLALRSSLVLIAFIVFIICLQYFDILQFDYSWEPRLSPVGSIIIGFQFLVLLTTSWISSTGATNQMLKIRSLIKQLDTLNKHLKREIILKTREIISSKTKLTKSYKTLQAAYNQLEDSEQDRFTRMNLLAHYGTLLTSVAHEMANPLMYVMAYIDEIPNEDKAEAKKNVDELADMVRTLRGSVRIGLPNDPINVSNSIKDAKKVLDWKLKKGDVKYSLKIEDKLKTKGDGSKFIQIILNLIDNAIDSGAKNIDVVVYRKNKVGHITISDDGGGIARKQRKKIFEIFYSTKDTGNGVGLYISKEYAKDLFKGNLKLEKTVKGKTTFNFSFKLPND